MRTAAQWADAINAWCAWLASAGRPDSTVRLRRYQLRALAMRHINDSPWQLTIDNLTTYMQDHNWSPETLKSQRAAMRSFYRWATLTGRAEFDPAHHLAGVRVPKSLPRPADDADFLAALEAADDRVRLMLLLGRRAGLRAGEIARVRLDDIDLTREEILIHGKGGTMRRVPLAPELEAALRTELTRRRDRETGTGYRWQRGIDVWLFPGPQGTVMRPASVSRILSRALSSATGHQLRHAFATAAHDGTGDLMAVQRLLGHSRPETTLRYTLQRVDALRAAVQAAST